MSSQASHRGNRNARQRVIDRDSGVAGGAAQGSNSTNPVDVGGEMELGDGDAVSVIFGILRCDPDGAETLNNSVGR